MFALCPVVRHCAELSVTGAGRGIGYDLVKQLSEQQNVIIYAGIRGAVAEYEQLVSLIAQYPDAIFPLKITSASQEDNSAAAEYVRSKEGKVDVIIANAGEFGNRMPTACLGRADQYQVGLVVSSLLQSCQLRI